MRAPARLLLVLAAASAVSACSDEAPVPAARRDFDVADQPVSPNAVPSATLKGGGPRGGRGEKKVDDGSIDGPDDVDPAALARAVLAVNVDDEGAVNAELLRFGAGIPPTSENHARRVAEELTVLTRSERPAMRRGAFALLARMPAGRLVGDPFVPATLDADAGVRRQAVIGRTRQGISRHWTHVLPLASDPDADVRKAVAGALAIVDQKEARDAVARLIADEDEGVVAAAAAALSSAGGATISPQIFEAARSPRPIVRRAAAVVLSSSRSPEAFRRLVALSNDETWSVRKEAVWGLSGFGGDFARDARVVCETIAYDADRRGRNERFEALQGLARTHDEPALDRLLDVAEKDRDVMLRMVAARSLALRGDRRAPAVLVSLLDTQPGRGVDDEEAIFVRRTAEAVLCGVADVKPGTRSAAEWRRALPDVEARLAKGRPSDTPPLRLAQCW